MFAPNAPRPVTRAPNTVLPLSAERFRPVTAYIVQPAPLPQLPLYQPVPTFDKSARYPTVERLYFGRMNQS